MLCLVNKLNLACSKGIQKCLYNNVITSTPNSLLISLFFHPSVYKIIELNLLAGEESFSSQLCTASDMSLFQTSFAFFAVPLPCSKQVRTTSWKTYFLSTALTCSRKCFTVGNFSNSLLWILAKFFFVWEMSTWASMDSTSSLWMVFDNSLAGLKTSIAKLHKMGTWPEVYFWYQCLNLFWSFLV